MNSRQALPVGSNMNDLSYPFRGDYRVHQALNHGHGGVQKARPTSLTLAIRGSDLTIEEIEVPQQCKLDCEIGCGQTRSVFVPQAVTIPNDGREYTLCSTVAGAGNSKHFCKLRLRGAAGEFSQDRGIVIDHSACGDPEVSFFCDNQAVLPDSDGLLCLPRNAKRCEVRPSTSAERSVVICCDDPEVQGSVVAGGVRYSLHGPAGARVPVNQGALWLALDRPPPVTFSPARASAEAPETDVSMRLEAGETLLTVSTHGAAARIEIEAGSQRATGLSACTLRLDAAVSHVASIVVRSGEEAAGAGATAPVLMRQRITVPRLAVAAGTTRISIDEGVTGKRVTAASGTALSVDNRPPVDGVAGCTIPRAAAVGGVVMLSARDQDGRETQLAFRDATADQFRWVSDLAAALAGLHGDDEVLRALQGIEPNSSKGNRIVAALRDLYARPKPELALKQTSPNTIVVSCPGFGVSAAHGAAPPCMLPQQGGSLQLSPDTPITVSALSLATGTRAASCVLSLSQAPPAAAPDNGAASFIRGLADALQGHQGDNVGAASAVQQVPSNNAGPDGPRLARLLGDALRSGGFSSSSGAGDDAGGGNGDSDAFIRQLLALFRAVPDDNTALSQGVAALKPAGADACELTPLLAAALQRGSTVNNLSLCAGTDVAEGVRLSAAIDAAPPFPLVPTAPPIAVHRAAQNITVSAIVATRQHPAASLPPSIIPRVAAIHAQTQELARRHELWRALEPQREEEWEMLRILLDLSSRLQQHRQPRITFTCSDGALQNISCPGFDVSASIDRMMEIPVTPGSSIPQGAVFVQGAQHEVTLVARDPRAANAVVASTAVTLHGQGGAPRAAHGLNFVDVDVSITRTRARVKMECPARFRISYTLDGIGSDALGSCVVAEVDPQRAHKLVLQVLDEQDVPVFQQQLCVPRLGNDAMSVALQDNKLLMDPPPGIITTLSVNGSQERTIDGAAILLNPDTPNRATLRQFVGDPSSMKVGELNLSLPLFIDPEDVKSLIRIYQCFDRNFGALTMNLMQLHATAHSALMRQLIGVLAARAHDNMQNERWQEYFDSVIKAIREISFTAPNSRSFFFRLKGEA